MCASLIAMSEYNDVQGICSIPMYPHFSPLITQPVTGPSQDIFTLSYVTGRSVGIGAYLNRLGQRVIQSSDGPLAPLASKGAGRLTLGTFKRGHLGSRSPPRDLQTGHPLHYLGPGISSCGCRIYMWTFQVRWLFKHLLNL